MIKTALTILHFTYRVKKRKGYLLSPDIFPPQPQPPAPLFQLCMSLKGRGNSCPYGRERNVARGKENYVPEHSGMSGSCPALMNIVPEVEKKHTTRNGKHFCNLSSEAEKQGSTTTKERQAQSLAQRLRSEQNCGWLAGW